MQHGDVVIHKEDSGPKEVWRPPQVQASLQETKLHQQEAEFDPWAESAKMLPCKQEAPTISMSSIESTLDQKIAKQLDAHMADKDEPMAPTVEPRLQALEQQMAILQQKAVQIDVKMEYLHQQVEHRLWESTDRKHGFRLPIPRKPSLWDFLRPGGSP
jgi:hypothetical protein